MISSKTFPEFSGCIQVMLSCRLRKVGWQLAELLHHQHGIRGMTIVVPLSLKPLLQLYGSALTNVQMCMQELLRRRRAFVMAMAELLRRRRAIRDAMMAVPHPDPTLGGVLCWPSCCIHCRTSQDAGTSV